MQLVWLALAMFLGMTVWFSATAANAPIAAEFHLSPAETAWLTMAVQGGFVVGTLVSALLNLPDIVNTRRLFAFGCVVAAASNAALVAAGGPAMLVALRVVTGVALAWVYPPGMKIAAEWFAHRRGAALGVVIGALTVGSAFPHLLASLSATLDWRTLMWVASSLALAGGAIVATVVGDGPPGTGTARFHPMAVLRVFSGRPARLATLGYLGHMWELYAVWTWIAAYASASFGVARGVTPSSPLGSAVAFTTIGSGAIGSAAAGWVADRLGKARVASWAMAASGACCAAAGFVFHAPPFVLFLFATVWGVAVVADSAQLSALVAEHSPRDLVGTALTIQTCAGFLLTMASIRLVPIAAQALGWQWVFICLAPGPVFGVLAMRGLTDAPRVRRPRRPSGSP